MRGIANDVDADVLSALTLENLKSDIGIESFGIRTKIQKDINELHLDGEWKSVAVSSAADLDCSFLLPWPLGISSFPTSPSCVADFQPPKNPRLRSPPLQTPCKHVLFLFPSAGDLSCLSCIADNFFLSYHRSK